MNTLTKVVHATPNTAVPAKEPKALQGFQNIRETLRKSSPAFEVAEASVEDSEAFCASVKADLRERRKRMRLDQTQIGAKLNLSQSAISKIESQRGDLGLETLYQYAEALGLRPAVVFIPTAESLAVSRAVPSALETPLVTQNAGSYSVQASSLEALQIALLRNMTNCIPELMAGLVKRVA